MERTLTFVGCELEPSGHCGAALAHRLGKANSVFAVWSPMLLNPDFSSVCQDSCVRVSVANSFLWQAGKTEPNSQNWVQWGARKVPRPDRQETKPGTLHWRALETDASCGHDPAARSSMDLREKVFEVKHRFAATSRDSRNALCCSKCSRYVTLPGGGNSRRACKAQGQVARRPTFSMLALGICF